MAVNEAVPVSHGPRGMIAVALLACYILPAMMATILAPVLPQIKLEFAGQPGADGLAKALITVTGLAAILGSPLTAPLLARFGARQLLVWGSLVFVVAGLAGLWLHDLRWLVAARFVVGGCGTLVATTGIAVVATRYPEDQRDRWMGFLVTAGSVYGVLFTLLAGSLGQAGWRMVLPLHLLALLPLAAAWFAFPAEQARDRPRADATAGRVAPRLAAVAVAVGIVSGVPVLTTMMFFPFHLHGLGVLDPHRVSLYLMPYVVTSTLASFCYGWVRRQLSIGSVFAVAFGVAAIGWIGLGESALGAGVVVTLVLAGIGSGLLSPNLFAFAASCGPPETRAQYIGFAKAGYFLSPLLAQLATSALVGGTPRNSVLLVGYAMALACPIAAGLWFAGARRVPAAGPRS